MDILDTITPDDAFNSSFEFKGQELKPFSEGRRSVAFSIGVRVGGDPGPTVADLHALMYICICPKSELAKAHRNPDWFWGKVLDWADANITPEDYEEEGRIVRRMLEAAFATRVTAAETGDAGNELGN
jgi:hypothetical protein